jgi:hypothetical protein
MQWTVRKPLKQDTALWSGHAPTLETLLQEMKQYLGICPSV